MVEVHLPSLNEGMVEVHLLPSLSEGMVEVDVLPSLNEGVVEVHLLPSLNGGVVVCPPFTQVRRGGSTSPFPQWRRDVMSSLPSMRA